MSAVIGLFPDIILVKKTLRVSAIIKENKITDFTKIWAKKNKGDVDNALQLGLIKQEDYNLLMHD